MLERRTFNIKGREIVMKGEEITEEGIRREKDRGEQRG